MGEDPQPTQEMFENLLALELYKINTLAENGHGSAGPVYIEDESQRIGRLNIPTEFLELKFESYKNLQIEDTFKDDHNNYGTILSM